MSGTGETPGGAYTPPPTPTTGDGTALPSQPGYAGASDSTATTASASGTDIWGLGQYYGQPVFTGTQRAAGISGNNAARLGQSPTAGAPVYDQFSPTQDFQSTLKDLWAAQSSERAKSPHAATQFESLQQELFAAGFYGQTAYKDIHAGQYTDQTVSAMTLALQNYERTTAENSTGTDGTPITFSEFLQNNAQMSSDGGFYDQSGQGGAAAAATQVNLTDPNEIRQAAQSAAQSALGMGLSDDQLNSFVSQFQSAQSGDQSSKAGSVTTPDLSSDANAFAQQQDPQGYQQHQVQGFQNAFASMFLSGASARPDTGVVAKA